MQRFSYQADCLDTRVQLPSPMLLASCSHPLCSARTECGMNIQQLPFAELVCLPLIVHLKCLFLKACGSVEQLYDSGAAEVVRLVIEVLILRCSYHHTDGSHHHTELCGFSLFF